MKIDHIAVYADDLEAMKDFFEQWFDCTAGSLYHNPKTGFSSYFVEFDDGSRLELMNNKDLDPANSNPQIGLDHISIGVGTPDMVDNMAFSMSTEGYPILSGPRTTGDGYYEAVIDGPEHLKIELTV